MARWTDRRLTAPVGNARQNPAAAHAAWGSGRSAGYSLGSNAPVAIPHPQLQAAALVGGMGRHDNGEVQAALQHVERPRQVRGFLERLRSGDG